MRAMIWKLFLHVNYLDSVSYLAFISRGPCAAVRNDRLSAILTQVVPLLEDQKRQLSHFSLGERCVLFHLPSGMELIVCSIRFPRHRKRSHSRANCIRTYTRYIVLIVSLSHSLTVQNRATHRSRSTYRA